tara:strand:+ start:4227 stop:4556 length:330 start_codon:yes stop_codon:yes gene_type:complete
MSWERLLKRGAGNITDKEKNFIDELMSDKKKRTSREIVEDLWNKLEEINAGRKRNKLSSRIIASEIEIVQYIGQSPKYESAAYDTITDKQRRRNPYRRTPHIKLKYWLK